MLAHALFALLALSSTQTVDLRTETLAARRTRLERRVALSPGWKLVESPAFFVFSEVDDKKFLASFAERATSFRALLEREFDPASASKPARPAEVLSVIVLYRDRDSYQRAGGPGGSIGHWTSLDQQIEVPDTHAIDGRAGLWRALQSTIVAEFFDRRLETLAIAPWYLYGLQDYFSGFEFKFGRWTPRLHLVKWQIVRANITGQKCLSLEDFIALRADEYYGGNKHGLDAADIWAQSWSLIWFLRHAEKSADWEPRWGEILPRYFDGWNSSRDLELAQHFAFDGVDFARLEKAWMRFMRDARR